MLRNLLRSSAIVGLLSASLFSGCLQAAPDCVTSNGIRLYGARNCDALEKYSYVVKDRFDRLGIYDTSVLTDFAVEFGGPLDRNFSFEGDDGKRYAGLSWCHPAVTIINFADYPYSTLAHEMAHLVSGCGPTDHEDWVTNGMRQAIWDVEVNPCSKYGDCQGEHSPYD